MPAPRLVVAALLAAACLSCSAPAASPPPTSAALVDAAGSPVPTLGADAAGRTALASRVGATVSILRLGATEVGGNLEAYVPPSLPAQVVTDLGLGRPAAQQVAGVAGQPPALSRIAVSTEQLTAHDADLIVDLEVGGMTNAGAVTTSPLWQRLGAVRSGHVVTASHLVWSVPSTVSVRRMVAEVVGGLDEEGTR